MTGMSICKQIAGSLSLVEALDQFLLAKESQGITHKSKRYYSDEVTRFIAYLLDKNITNILDVTPEHIRLFLRKMGETRNKGGVHASYRPIRAMFLWYENEVEPEGWKNPVHKIKLPPPRPVAIPGVTMEQYARIIAACTGAMGQRDKALFYCLLDSCARAEEFIHINVGDVNLIRGDVLIRVGKGGDPRYVAFETKSRRELRKYLKTRDKLSDKSPLFVTRAGDRFTYNGLVSLVRWRCAQAKVERPGLHDIRRAGALEMLRNGADISQISKYLGHRSIEVTLRYLAITPDDLRKMHQRCGPVDHADL